jgi:transcriptional regulator with XRE-family HTH domain
VDPLARLAANIKMLRDEKGMTQEDLADAAHLHRTAVSLIERREREPRLTTIVVLARALGTTPSRLLDGIE